MKSFNLIFRNGNVLIDRCNLYWDTNPLYTIQDGNIIKRGEGESIRITAIKEGYKSAILLDTNSLDSNKNIFSNLERLNESKYIYVTPYAHACQYYQYFKPSTPTRWQRVTDSEIEVIPSDNWITKYMSARCFKILIDSSSNVTVRTTKGIKQSLTNFNCFREFTIDTDLQPKGISYGTITITNKDNKKFVIRVVSQFSED